MVIFLSIHHHLGNFVCFFFQCKKAKRFCSSKMTTTSTTDYIRPRRLRHIPELERTQDVCLAAVKRNGGCLYHVPHFTKTEEICLEAVKKNGCALCYVPNLMRTEEMCLKAVSENGLALQYVPDELKTFQMYKNAILSNISVLSAVTNNAELDSCAILEIDDEKKLCDLMGLRRLMHAKQLLDEELTKGAK